MEIYWSAIADRSLKYAASTDPCIVARIDIRDVSFGVPAWYGMLLFGPITVATTLRVLGADETPYRCGVNRSCRLNMAQFGWST